MIIVHDVPNISVSTSIVCQTSASRQGQLEREVKVSVVDVTKTTARFDLRGSADSGQSGFQYKVG